MKEYKIVLSADEIEIFVKPIYEAKTESEKIALFERCYTLILTKLREQGAEI